MVGFFVKAFENVTLSGNWGSTSPEACWKTSH